jgi:hypothetical protein
MYACPAIDGDFAAIFLTVNFPLITPGTPIWNFAQMVLDPQQVRYRLMTIGGDNRLHGRVGTLLEAKRTLGVVDFGERLGRWKVELWALEPYPEEAPETHPGGLASATT